MTKRKKKCRFSQRRVEIVLEMESGCTSQLKVDTVSNISAHVFKHSTPYTVLESGSLKSMQDVLH